MSEHLVEAEQVEQIKQFLRHYGKPIAVGVILGLSIMFAWKYWMHYQQQQEVSASIGYENLLNSLVKQDQPAIKAGASFLIQHYPNSPYASEAALILAREAVTQQDYAEAEKQLNWVIEEGKSTAMQSMAKIRLARVQLSQGSYDEALGTLNTVKKQTNPVSVLEVKGDILAAQGDREGALKAYTEALGKLEGEDFKYPLLKMKYDDLAETMLIMRTQG